MWPARPVRVMTAWRIAAALALASACGGGGAGRDVDPAGSGGASGAGAATAASGGRDAGGGATTNSGGSPAGGGAAPAVDGGGGTGDSAPAPPDDAQTAAQPADTNLGGDRADDATGPAAPPVQNGAVTWAIDNVQSIGGHPTTISGAPTVIDTPAGKALAFDGVDDALFIENHPLAGLAAFTVEIIFRPDAGGAAAQRFFHMQEGNAPNGSRVLFETRLPSKDTFIVDVFVESGAGKVALYTPKFTHPLGAWYNATAVVDGKRAHHYINGVEESAVDLPFTPHRAGRTSIGVRLTKMYFFKGAIRAARFTPRALTPAEFLAPN